MNQRAILKQLFSAYPGSQATDETVAMYIRLLQDIPDGELQVIVDQAVSVCKYLPTIAEIKDMHFKLANIGRLTWSEAWENVQSEMRRIGSYGRPDFADEITAKVVKAMGWRALCASENGMADRAQFRDMYNDHAARVEFSGKLTPQAQQLAQRLNGALVGTVPLLGDSCEN